MPLRKYNLQPDYADLVVIPEDLLAANGIYSNDHTLAADHEQRPSSLNPPTPNQLTMGNPGDWKNDADECMISELTPNCWNSPDCPNSGFATGPCAALGALRGTPKTSPPARLASTKSSKMPTTSDDSISPPSAAVKPGKSRTRLPHNLIERRYRNHLNRQIDSLRLVVPALQEENMSQVDVEDGIPLRPPSKADIIAASTTYIKDLEAKNAELVEFTQKLQDQIDGLQALVKCDDCSILKYLNSLQLGGSPDQRSITSPGE